MESFVIELIKPITLEKENHTAKVFEEGTILKVLLKRSFVVSSARKRAVRWCGHLSFAIETGTAIVYFR